MLCSGVAAGGQQVDTTNRDQTTRETRQRDVDNQTGVHNDRRSQRRSVPGEDPAFVVSCLDVRHDRYHDRFAVHDSSHQHHDAFWGVGDPQIAGLCVVAVSGMSVDAGNDVRCPRPSNSRRGDAGQATVFDPAKQTAPYVALDGFGRVVEGAGD